MGHACFRTLQFIRAPNLISDFRNIENAVGQHLPEWRRKTTAGFRFRWRIGRGCTTSRWRKGIWTGFLTEYFVLPLLAGLRYCNGLERSWTNFLAGSPAAGPPGKPDFLQHVEKPFDDRFAFALARTSVSRTSAGGGDGKSLSGGRQQSTWLWCSPHSPWFAGGEWIDFVALDWNATPQHALHDVDGNLHWSRYLVGRELLVIDRVSAPLLPLASWLYFLTILATEQTRSPSLFVCGNAFELGSDDGHLQLQRTVGIRGAALAGNPAADPGVAGPQSADRRVCPAYGLRALLFFIGCCALHFEGVDLLPFAEARRDSQKPFPTGHSADFSGGVDSRRSGAIVTAGRPICSNGEALGTAILSVAPMTGAYAAVRLVLPFAADEVVLHSHGRRGFVHRGFYAAGMSLVQTDPRRFFCYLFLSHSALILAGSGMVTVIGLTGALCLWTSSAVSP